MRNEARRPLLTRSITAGLTALLLLSIWPSHARAVGGDQIELLEKLIENTDKADPEYPDFLFRLADLKLGEKSRSWTQAVALDERIYAAKDAGKLEVAADLSKRQAGYVREAQRASAAAAQTLRALADEPTFASYNRMDEVLYLYASELGELGDVPGMQAAYVRLLKDFPSSPFVPNAYLSLADHHFNAGALDLAVPLYDKVTQFPDSPVHAYALYKLGWCHLTPIGQANARYDESLQFFVATIQATIDGRAGSEAAGKQLRREARRDLVRAYAHVGKPSKAWAFFKKVGRGPGDDEDDARHMMELLADLYRDAGQDADADVITDRLLKL